MIGGLTYQLESSMAYKMHQCVDDVIATNGCYFGCHRVYHIPYFSSDGTIVVGSTSWVPIA